MLKNILATFIVTIYILTYCSTAVFAKENFYQGRVEDTQKPDNKQSAFFTGKVNKVNKNKIVKMTVSQNLDTTSSKNNDEFFAEITEDITCEDGVIIPTGTLAHGKILKTSKAKGAGINGSLVLNFDTLITPEGREIPIEGKMTTKPNPIAGASEALKTNVVYVTAGAAAGGVLALGIFGLSGAVASSGTTLAGGAALGGSIGLGMAIAQKGKEVEITPNDEIRVKVNSLLDLPVYKNNILQSQDTLYDGLDVAIKDINYKRSRYGNADTIMLSLSINNMTDKTFSIFDIAVVDKFNVAYYPNIFDNEKLFDFQIKPNDKIDCVIPFSVDNVKTKLWLTFYDKQTKKVIEKISIDKAYKSIPTKSIAQNNRLVEKKKNFYKEQNPFE